MNGLPKQESADALLTGCADHQVGIRLAGRVEMLGDVLHVEDLRELLDRRAARGVLVQQRAHRVGDLPPAAVSDRDVDQQARVFRGGLRGVLEHAGRLAREEVQRTHRVQVPAPGDQPTDCLLDDPEQRLELGGGPRQVVGGQQPQGDHLHAGFTAPLEQLEDLVGALLVADTHIEQPGRPGPPPVAVTHHADVPRNRRRGQGSFEPASVEPVDQATKSHVATFLSPLLS
jgi:hypothetical protein